MKLGKKSPRVDRRTLKLALYMTPELPNPPDVVTNSRGQMDWGVMGNDVLSDCTIAAAAHAVQVWTQAQGKEITLLDSDVLSYYQKWDGYNPQDPSTDEGGVALDVLNCWRKEGLSGHNILGYAQSNSRNSLHNRQAIAIFGGLYVGLNMPVSAQGQKVWEFDPSSEGQPGSWGGHAVFVPDYDLSGLTCITWGRLQKMTWEFFKTYCDEAYAIVSSDWPAGFDAQAFQTDLAAIV